ncbi:hypothetical protein GCK72_015247 [Caenorhabditis remanei]|uniref:Uncharacterized protein n=1 Tax=Caenorhabditis remanei TaxID=31234 RepID=A0A6A5GUC0_CAERE|nr:hypothetical protein GCK72_015247 [Caenorhabditis remanei]KAF1758787.1 hypothetical protein GCK72_015247 [Caenorhabditis remanei]
MEIARLSELSLQSVVDYICNGIYDNVDYKLSPNLSNQIYHSVINKAKEAPNKNIIKQIKNKLQLTKINHMYHKLNRNTMEMFRSHILDHLMIGFLDFDDFGRKYKDENDLVDIVSVLEDSMTYYCRRNLKLLTIRVQLNYQSGWAEVVGEMLPNLETLNITGIKLTGQELPNLCKSFPKLKTLDISFCAVTNLNGISNLKNLEVLIIRGLNLATPEDMDDLFECKKLRMLDFAKSNRNEGASVMWNYMKCGKVLEELEFLDCNGTDIDKSMVEVLMSTHKKLRTIVTLDSILDFSTIPGIELLNSSTPQLMIKSLHYYIAVNRNPFISWMLSLFRKTYLVQWTEDGDQQVLRDFVRVICSAMKNFCWDPCVFYEGVKCLLEITKEGNIKGLGPMEISMLIDQLIESGTKSRTLTYDVEKLNAAYSCSWNLFHQPQILYSPLLKIQKLCWYTVDFLASEFAPSIPTKQLNILWHMLARFDTEDAKKLCQRTDLLDSLLDFLRICNTESQVFMEEHRESINIVLEVIYSMTKVNDETAHHFINKKVQKIHAIPLMIQLSDIKWNRWPEQIKVFEILVNLTRVEKFMKRWGRYLRMNSKFLRNQLKGYYKYLYTSIGTYLATDKAYCSMTILSCLMCLPNKNKKKYYKWKIENTEMVKACQKIQTAHISMDLEFYLSCSILHDTLKKSKYDGPVMWALLTMKAMLERDIDLVEIFKDSGLLSVVQRVRSEEKGVMKLKLEVLRLLY